jgi:hypothetical protein
MSHEHNPIQRAKFEDNKKALRAMGKKGNEHAAATRAAHKEEKVKRETELALQNAETGEISDEGDVLPPDDAKIEALRNKLENPPEN